MVMFVCNTCGESLKKNKVEEHYKFHCRNCESVSCIDCGRDFFGDDYLQHLTCISEQEKYQGVVPENKGQQKQEQWVTNVTDVISTYKGSPRVRTLLQKCVACSNLPRKQKKFVNFVKSSFHEHDFSVLNEAWAIIDKASKLKLDSSKENSPEAVNGASGGTESVDGHTRQVYDSGVSEDTESGEEARGDGDNAHSDQPEEKAGEGERGAVQENGDAETTKEKKKKKKHEHLEQLASLQNTHGKKLSKKQLKRLREESISLELAPEAPEQDNDAQTGVKGEKKNKKNKNRPQQEESTEESENNTAERKESRVKGMKDVPQNLNRVEEEVEGEGEQEEGDDCMKGGHFNWHKAIKLVLKAEDDRSLPVKKLRKKVLAEFMECGGGEGKVKNENEIYALFEKKLHSYPKAKIQKDRVTLLK